jgi:5-methylcytosine-specific restriction endonuclease McrA
MRHQGPRRFNFVPARAQAPARIYTHGSATFGCCRRSPANSDIPEPGEGDFGSGLCGLTSSLKKRVVAMSAGRSRTVRPELSKASWRKTREFIKQRDHNTCQVCGSNGWIPGHFSKSGRWIPSRQLLVVGHIVPAERFPGSHDSVSNLRTMCSSCNNSQRDLDDDQWRVAKAARGQPSGSTITTDYTRHTVRQTIFSVKPKVL